ncbi:MAG TPA: ribosome biogenesis GTPase Der [Candidatus Fimadaptatus faecigallinarum]|uniref:GTPase Der n=1 Tax=Candidatus Fimadaptatus faecigallinarum TaxID=2840814 RepID=A0A9D1S418_9FIRM|nr:ribosome biogenesis GTPase Der [Candidatus Fimadaptatus faecigallinarum]
MAKPLIAIVGRPNVGKSTFFNKMAGRRISIVEDTPGVTRDRVYADCEWQNRAFTLIDTGGIDPNSDDPLLKQMRAQAEIAIETCDAILFFVDGRQGLTDDDKDVATMLRKSSKPILVVVNKIDSVDAMDNMYEFYELGLGDPIAISSVNLMNIGDLLEELMKLLPESDADEQDDERIKIAVVGRPNVGKSSIVNRILGQERVMVSDIAGTTRDAIDTGFERDGRSFVIIDTAGIRRKRAIEDATVERYSVIRSFAAIDRCDVALIVIDAQDGVTEQDTKIAGYVHEQGKAALVVVNKWDLVDKDTGTLEKYRKQVIEDLKFMDYAPVVFVSALTGQRLPKLVEGVVAAYDQATRRITTGLLNDVLADAMAAQQPPSQSGRRLKIYYATQQGVKPPLFIMFVNDQTLMHYSYERYLENFFRKSFGFEGTPIRFILRERKKEES